MKVLSIKEPYSTLICNNKKRIETRSFKTNYRGELYIHSSISKTNIKDEKLLKIINNDKLNYGKIICKCKLVDCIYMTNDFINEIKKDKQEYICGYYEEGRYAWILEDIEPLKDKIDALGNLGIWNYYTLDDTINIMNDIDYGYIDSNNKKYININDIDENYILQEPKNILKNKIGVCYDQVELERNLLRNNKLNIKTYFIVGKESNNKYHTHTFLTYEKDNKYYWFEHSWNLFKGIHKYNTNKELIEDVKNKFIKYELNNNDELDIYEYKKPKYNISLKELNNHFINGVKYE